MDKTKGESGGGGGRFGWGGVEGWVENADNCKWITIKKDVFTVPSNIFAYPCFLNATTAPSGVFYLTFFHLLDPIMFEKKIQGVTTLIYIIADLLKSTFKKNK